VKNDGAAIRALSTAASAARGRVERLFDEMAALGKELQEKERAYDEELV